MKLILAALGTAFVIAFPPDGQAGADNGYVCTNADFAVPESFDPSDVAESRLIAESNPNRFEAHLILAAALAQNGQLPEAVQEFQIVDRLVAEVTNSEVIAKYPYKDLYGFTLFGLADKYVQAKTNTLETLQMLSQAVQMAPITLARKGKLSRCFLYLATLSLQTGDYMGAIQYAEQGKATKDSENDTSLQTLFDAIETKAKQKLNGAPLDSVRLPTCASS